MTGFMVLWNKEEEHLTMLAYEEMLPTGAASILCFRARWVKKGALGKGFCGRGVNIEV